ncbi:hypothetical protein N7495_000136 [Penicillium taxi]|uniref:uncharacterized protein n=1 Tax=Penicillium taxi TaxID=168475 RepID=UPI002545140B|nr:uncharacterized protein N7495_000136 [Penicillium taxi]KAJ5907454.1 hypothetical protein N7495_000136 [Penicillium taxi]
MSTSRPKTYLGSVSTKKDEQPAPASQLLPSNKEEQAATAFMGQLNAIRMVLANLPAAILANQFLNNLDFVPVPD